VIGSARNLVSFKAGICKRKRPDAECIERTGN
jgi:hypothetical protein